MSKEKEEGVGYCRPPRATRFKKGVSGNPAGRPKGSISVRAQMQKLVQETVSVRIDGVARQMTAKEAMCRAQLVGALQGGTRNFDRVVSILGEQEDGDTRRLEEEPPLTSEELAALNFLVERQRRREEDEQ